MFSTLRRRLTQPALAASLAPALRRTFVTESVKGSAAWKLGHLNHVAIAVPNMEQASSFWRDVMQADKVSESVPMPEHGVYTVFVELGNTKIELLHPYGDKSPIAGFLAKNASGGIHHICLNVSDIREALATLKAKGVRALNEEPKTGAHGLPVVFLHPKDCGGVLVELEEHRA
ncbi:methylmalonyl-CoA epimerase [Martensiomyces pterosporus]|nr:methylmalonyl-CoA epimerase [Martensiomyces pterosporus]